MPLPSGVLPPQLAVTAELPCFWEPLATYHQVLHVAGQIISTYRDLFFLSSFC